MNAGLYSSNMVEWSTPQDFFDVLDYRFHFTLDPCATPDNTKCPKYYTEADDGLSKNWEGETVFMNPPYGRQIGKWVDKAWQEGMKPNTTVVCLIPARTDTSWWHTYVVGGGADVEFVRGRLKFGGSKWNAPFPSAVVIFRARKKRVMKLPAPQPTGEQR